MLKKFILKFHHLSNHNEEETEKDDNPNKTDNVPEIFKIEENLFDFEIPLCEEYHEFNCLLNIDTDLFTYYIQNLKTYDEYEREMDNNKVKGAKELWSENGVPCQLCDHICEPYRFKNGKTKWYDELADGKLKDETLALKAKIEGSWGDATPEVVKFCRWLNSCFENFHELEYEVLVKLQEWWWKVNAHEITLFTRMENFRRGPYANIKTEWASNPYLDMNRTFGRDYKADNIGCTQENQGHKGNLIPEPSNCKVKRFKMMKYSFDDDEEYITIKESEYLKHSKD
ncbi:hypothetical protein Tco_1467325, partial [Tanacetum coccineum]